MLAERAEAIRRVCFDLEPSTSDLDALGHQERWLVYRGMVRRRLAEVVARAVPRTKTALGAEGFERVFAEWLGAGGPKTRYFRLVPADFMNFALPIWRDQSPEWLADLGEYELTRWQVRYASSKHEPGGEFAFDRAAVMNPALALLSPRFPVHEPPRPANSYQPADTRLCLYRDKKHEVVTWELNPLAADLVQAWIPGDKTVAETVQEVAAAHDTEIGPAFVEKLSAMIADFIDRGVILGGRA